MQKNNNADENTEGCTLAWEEASLDNAEFRTEEKLLGSGCKMLSNFLLKAKLQKMPREFFFIKLISK